jgi:prepilin-type N-terminal cleavage/methylation domain-containing protein
MNMKKFTKASAKGFTLVELIVVIVILAILATIAFLSFSSQSASARDSKRKADISNLASKMTAVNAQNGKTFVQMITPTTGAELTTGYIGGNAVAAGSTYDAGTVNFQLLGGINAEEFKDPWGNDYEVGATTLGGAGFQLVSALETKDGEAYADGALIKGNFNSRGVAKDINVTFASGSSTVTKATLNDNVGYFAIGDIINTGTACKVTSVSSSKEVVTFTCTTVPSDGTVNIQLAEDEITSLVKGKDGSTAVADGSNAPYSN